MKLTKLNPKQALNSVFYQQRVNEKEFNSFKLSFEELIKEVSRALHTNQTEDVIKNSLIAFLKKSIFKDNNCINSKAYKGQHAADLVIHSDKSIDSKVNVIFELKSHKNKQEMSSLSDINKKSIWEAVLYYLWEKIEYKNNDVTHIIITDIFEWFIFDAKVFNDLFYENKDIQKEFVNWKRKATDNDSTSQMYEYIKQYIEDSDKNLEFIYFSIENYGFDPDNVSMFETKKDDLIEIYKIFTSEHLLKNFRFDSNSLNLQFYNELLYLIGLEEISEKGKKLIKRKAQPIEGTLIEGCINKFKSLGKLEDEKEETIFENALELCLMWVNRILFLKLLEVQLINYHHGDRNYGFLNKEKITEFDELETLFFEILAVKQEERNSTLKNKYSHIPYLNSSLFEVSKMEKELISISNLKDHVKIPVFSNTVLKDSSGNKIKNTEIEYLNYLLDFLNSFNFGYVGKEIIQNDKKDLINASVLGLVFEKINGYKDGSFFTPGYITEYMSRDVIRKAVTQKFKEKFNWKIDDFIDIGNYLTDKRSSAIKSYNEVINSLKICDPAVGSGHFLVSCMNEILAIKSELGILADDNGKLLSDYSLIIENDTLIIKCKETGELFDYKVSFDARQNIRNINEDVQRVQMILFNEKKNIIENCLFGVDINDNSVNIARLRLWIEILKNSYYTKESGYHELDTLPNIDINIRCGNSLISKYPLTKQFSTTVKVKPQINLYKNLVNRYKNVTDKTQKKKIVIEIDNCKKFIFSNGIVETSEKSFQLNNLRKTYSEKFGHSDSLSDEFDKKTIKKFLHDRTALENKIKNLKDEITEEYILKETLFKKVFEWRFEFPEILDDNGEFIGFDIVIGNPPYQQLQKDEGKLANQLEKLKYKTFVRTGDIYILFFEKGFEILSKNGFLNLITSNKWMRANYGELARDFLANNTKPIKLIDFCGFKVFTEAVVDTNILVVQKAEQLDGNNFYACSLGSDFKIESGINQYFDSNKQIMPIMSKDIWVLSSNIEEKIKNKIESFGTQLSKWDIKLNRGLTTGLNEAFIIDEKTKNKLLIDDYKTEEILKPLLRGRDIKRYKADFSNLWLIMFPKGFTIKSIQNKKANIVSEPIPHYGWVEYDPAWDFIESNYPAVANHLIKFKDKAEKRQDVGDYWWELRACAYLEEFEKEKIIFTKASFIQAFALDKNKYSLLNTSYFLTGINLEYILSLLNSKLINYAFKNFYQSGGIDGEITLQAINQISIPKISIKEQILFVNTVNRIIELKNENSKADTTKLELELDYLICRLYGLSSEEIDFIINYDIKFRTDAD